MVTTGTGKRIRRIPNAAKSSRQLPDPSREPTISVERAGKVLGLGRSASYDAARRGELPTLLFGRRIVVPTSRLLALLNGPPAEQLGSDRAADQPS